MNKAIIMGNLARDPEIKWINKENCVVKFQLATNEQWFDKDGNKVKKTDWHNCSAWGKRAEIIHKYVKKGDKIVVEGKIRNNNFETKDKNKVYGYEIVVENFEFCGGKKNENDTGDQANDSPPPLHESQQEEPVNQKTRTASNKQSKVSENGQDDDIPF